jgi:outer membrane protein OmpA-like peptidoglycan-associated protein
MYKTKTIMKFTTTLGKKLAIVSAIIFFSATSCSIKMLEQPEMLEYKMSPAVWVLKGDSVQMESRLSIPNKFFHKKGVLKTKLVLVSSSSEIVLDQIDYVGEKSKEKGIAVPFENGIRKSKGYALPYKPEFENSKIVVRSEASVKKKSKQFPDVQVANATITTQNLFRPDFRALNAAEPKPKPIPPATATVFFDINKSTIRKNESEKSDVQAFLGELKNRPVMGRVRVQGYASPDGRLDKNNVLAEQRAESVANLMSKTLERKSKNKKQKASEWLVEKLPYEQQSQTEDWTALASAIRSSGDLSDNAKMMSVIQGAGSNADKQKSLKKMGTSYKVLADKYLPTLRRTQIEYVVDFDPAKKAREEALAAMTPDAAEKAKLDQLIVDFPDSYVGYNNLAAWNIRKGNMDEASRLMDQAAKLSPNSSEVLNNLGVLAALKSNYRTASSQFAQAARAGAQVDYNMGLCAIPLGDWATAGNRMARAEDSYNKVLALILAENYAGASASLEQITEKDAAFYYLRAILGSRTDNRDMMTTSLTRAVALSGSYRDKASRDAEFVKHWDKDYFQVSIR